MGIQVADLFREDRLRERLARLMASKEIILRHRYGIQETFSIDDLMESLHHDAMAIARYVCDTSKIICMTP